MILPFVIPLTAQDEEEQQSVYDIIGDTTSNQIEGVSAAQQQLQTQQQLTAQTPIRRKVAATLIDPELLKRNLAVAGLRTPTEIKKEYEEKMRGRRQRLAGTGVGTGLGTLLGAILSSAAGTTTRGTFENLAPGLQAFLHYAGASQVEDIADKQQYHDELQNFYRSALDLGKKQEIYEEAPLTSTDGRAKKYEWLGVSEAEAKQIGLPPQKTVGKDILYLQKYVDVADPTKIIGWDYKRKGSIPDERREKDNEAALVLDAEKRGLEQVLIARYGQKAKTGEVNFNKILLGEQPIPTVDGEGGAEELTEDQKKLRDSLKAVGIKAQVKSAKEDPDVHKWLQLVAKIETLLKANEREYTPAVALAWQAEHPNEPYPQWIEDIIRRGAAVTSGKPTPSPKAKEKPTIPIPKKAQEKKVVR